ncbi:glycosyltransferase, partial [Mangrovicoccus sp. HB182678]|nr:glycosyltransferase [Mangrovicoccus algicola]
MTEDTGGHLAYILGAARAQAAREDVQEVTLLTRAFDEPRLGPEFARAEEVLGPGLRILRLSTSERRYLEKDALERALPELQRAFLDRLRQMGARRPTILHAHFADAAQLAAAAHAEFGIPWIYSCHSLGAEKLRPGERPSPQLARRIARERQALEGAHAVIASSRDEAERQIPSLLPAAEGRTHRIGPGVSLHPGGDAARARRRLAPFLRDPDRPVILAVARPIPKKNLVALVEAYAALPALRARANLVILAGLRDGLCGGGRAQDGVIAGLFDAVDRHDLWGRVALPRRHDARDLADLYALAAEDGAFCNPALHEPFGLTLVEAAQSGVPLVATRCGGPADIVARIGAGELVDPDSVASIAAGLQRSFADPARLQKARAAALAARHAYDWTAWAAQVAALARRLAPTRTAP